ncbi:MAG: glycosyltransferase [Alphaproteobacteria bacterium]|nr:glycosyltransferase [Alphaproteobacteria bacterium]
MHLLHISSGLDPRTGGTASAAITMAIAARRGGAEVTLVTAGALTETQARQLAENQIVIRAFPFCRWLGSLAAEWGISPRLHLWVWLNLGDYDGVLAHSPFVLTSFLALITSRLRRRRLVLVSHEGLTLFVRRNGKRSYTILLKEILTRIYGRFANRILFASDLERLNSGMERHYDSHRLVVLALPVIDELRLARPRRPTTNSDALTVGFLGRIHPKKNLHLLVAAVAALPQVRLIISGAGDEALEERIKTMIRQKKLSERVEWLGFIQDAAKVEFFARIDLLVVPSIFESFAMVAAEAMGHSVPVMLSPTVGVAEWVERHGGGMIVPPRPDALVVAIARLERESLRELGLRAETVARENFSYKNFGLLLTELFAAEIAKPKPGRRHRQVPLD